MEYDYSSFKSLLSSKPTELKRSELIEIFNDTENFVHVHKNNKLNGNYEELE
jgi:hypothetical protein